MARDGPVANTGYIVKVCIISSFLLIDLAINNTADSNDLQSSGNTNPIIFIG